MSLPSAWPLALLPVLLGAGCASPGSSDEDSHRPPNIVVILADDMGHGDVWSQNPSSRVPTPHLDGLALDGMRFTDAHSPSAVCTPTRYGLLTGRYAWRTRLKSGVLNGYGKPLIEGERITLPEHLATVGYDTAMVGKWHLGLGFVGEGDDIDYAQTITDGAHTHGFDYSYIIPASLDFPPYVYIEDGRVTAVPVTRQARKSFPAFLREGPIGPDLDMEGCLDHLTDRAVESIHRQAAGGRPFFLYFALTAPHKPLWPHERFRGKSQAGPYGDFIMQVDDTVGRVLAAIDEAGVRENTLVIYTSDNGSYMHRTTGTDHLDDETKQAYRAEHHSPNGIWRGTKADIWEAGHRVPFLVRWPERVAAGTSADATISLTDLYATFAELTAPAPSGAAPDSTSFLPLLDGRSDAFTREPVIHHSVAGMFAIRQGPWKLVLGNGSGGRQKPKGKPFEEPYTLFNLANDPSETTDLFTAEPEIAENLQKAFARIHERVDG